MKFDHIVNHNGTYYKAGEDVPAEFDKESFEEGMSNPEMGENDLPFSDTDIELEEEPARRGRPRKTDM